MSLPSQSLQRKTISSVLTLFLFVFLMSPRQIFNTVPEQNGDRKIELIYEDLGTSYVTLILYI